MCVCVNLERNRETERERERAREREWGGSFGSKVAVKLGLEKVDYH